MGVNGVGDVAKDFAADLSALGVNFFFGGGGVVFKFIFEECLAALGDVGELFAGFLMAFGDLFVVFVHADAVDVHFAFPGVGFGIAVGFGLGALFFGGADFGAGGEVDEALEGGELSG